MNALKTKKRKLGLLYATMICGSLSILAFFIYLRLSAYPKGIKPPFGQTQPYIEQVFKAEKGTVFHSKRGTHLVIPANALVDKDGIPVKGNVKLRFREFHSATEILVSGIPMVTDTDRSGFLASGGMLDLRVTSLKNEPLQVARGAQVDVALAANFRPSSDYKLYFLEEDEVWDSGSSNFTTTENTLRDSLLKNLVIPIKPISPIDSSELCFVLAFDPAYMTTLKPWLGTEWKVINASEKEREQLTRINWKKIDIKSIGNGTYSLHLKSNQKNYEGELISHEVNVKAKPQLSEEALQLAQRDYEQKMQKYSEQLAKRDAEEERLLNESILLNRFKINNFGIFNIDCAQKFDVFATVKMEFDFQEEIFPELNKVMLFMVADDRNSVVQYNAFDWNNIPVFSRDCYLFACLPGDEVAFISKEEFNRKLGTDNLNPLFTKTIQFKTERISTAEFFKRITSDDQPTKTIAR